MQYILTATEYNELTEEPKRVRRQLSYEIQRLCTRIAEKEYGGCYLTTDTKDFYCDKCPVRKECPYKQLSK